MVTESELPKDAAGKQTLAAEIARIMHDRLAGVDQASDLS